MNVMVPIPDALAARFGSEAELGRRAVEALALEEYRAGRLSRVELSRLLGLESDSALENFLQAHGVTVHPAIDTSTGQSVEATTETTHADADDLVARFKAFAARHTLGGLDVKELISEGRR